MNIDSSSIFLFSKEYPENIIGGVVQEDKPRYFYNKQYGSKCLRIELSPEGVTVISCVLKEALEASNAVVGLYAKTKGSVARNVEKIVDSGCFLHEDLEEVLGALERASVRF